MVFSRVQSISSLFARIQFLDAGNSFIELGYTKQIKLWKLNKEDLQISQQIEFQSSISTVSVSNNKNTLVIGFLDGTLKIFA